MSLSNIKLNILIALGLGLVWLWPQPTQAGLVLFENDKWELNPVVINQAPQAMFAPKLSAAAKSQMLLSLENNLMPIWDSKSLTAIQEIKTQIDQSPISAHLVVDNLRATEFEPGQNGQSLDVRALLHMLPTDNPVMLPVIITNAKTKLAQTNDLEITELVAMGESDFAGSPHNRLVNIKVGADKFNGIILKPGEEFSFNKFLGDVDEKNGFLPELVIKRSGLVPELGGGLCQVSSTTFRAAMNAGLNITERRNHSFAVRYYAPQGTDATIYPGFTDFRFANDLKSHLLIRTRMENNKLYFEFYGTKDDRQVVFEGPTQYDKKEDGSMKAYWKRTVINQGVEQSQTFRSTYLPPALFTQTSSVESSIPNPASENQNPEQTQEPG